ncbi:type III secretion system needle filament subunit SctF [Caballeronia sp. EK]|uniref:type III secretion system needle filament subunit SctF n=1 Tax=Caballeronia sp. EK TaxID=2767469 RepID=UPI0016552441|nr:type III secretion system needle filament subunit SctF [Caballeronia sp. EK]MBC8642804.1 type III secretion system needle filament subunit SctF [Caballeronia sp. EK]
MNIDAIAAGMGNQITRIASDADAAMRSDVVNNPEDMLKAQFELNRYSVMLGYESSVLKALKDMMMGVISKIG